MEQGQPQFGVGDFSGVLPLFPLPGVVLYPCTLLPLHIFEPRYRAMVVHANAGEGFIGMVMLKPGWEKEYGGNPAIHEVAGLGKIVETVKLPDGRFNIVICGVKRVKIETILSDRPYRTARVEVLEDASSAGHEAEGEALRERLLEIAEDVPREHYRHKNMPRALRKLDAPLGCTTDLLADSLLLPPAIKQDLLGELDPLARAEMLVRAVDRELRVAPASLVVRRFPGEPSIN